MNAENIVNTLSISYLSNEFYDDDDDTNSDSHTETNEHIENNEHNEYNDPYPIEYIVAEDLFIVMNKLIEYFNIIKEYFLPEKMHSE